MQNSIQICMVFLFLLPWLHSCKTLRSDPPPKNEFRGVWIATVANIDWPDSPNSSWEDQKKAYLEILDFYQRLNFNTVIVQIRTAGDAFYDSDLAPWSRYLTGMEGERPDTNEDPLNWLIETAHRKGFEFHAWLNPYRATFDMNIDLLSEQHDFNECPDWMIPYGNKYYYDPGIPDVRDHLVAIMAEVTERYKVDGLHFDDYFYPYRRADEVFQDTLSFKNYAEKDQTLEDWRRANIDALIKQVHDTLAHTKPWVQFGISPFGVWKNKSQDPEGSDTKAGQTNYYDLYADPLKWMKEGWIDYVVPQVYWSMDYEPAAYRKLVPWWSEHKESANLYIGNAAYKIKNNSDKAWKKKKELAEQLQYSRSISGIKGNVFFSANSLMKNYKVSRLLGRKLYRYPALPPSSPRPRIALYEFPELEKMELTSTHIELYFTAERPDYYKFAILYLPTKKSGILVKDPSQILSKLYLDGKLNFNIDRNTLGNSRQFAITFIDLYGSESQPIILHLDQYGKEK